MSLYVTIRCTWPPKEIPDIVPVRCALLCPRASSAYFPPQLLPRPAPALCASARPCAEQQLPAQLISRSVSRLTSLGLVQNVQAIESVKTKIFAVSGVPTANQRLFFRGRELPNAKLNELLGQEFPCKVGDFGIEPGDTLHVLASALVL